jgi:anaerobic ribonucleoside-triphosphate reductase activating protein
MTRIAGLDVNTTDDPFGGVCLSIFAAGCRRRCPGCHNPQLQDFSAGEHILPGKLFSMIEERKDLIDAVAYMGGDFLYYLKPESIDYLFEVAGSVKLGLQKRNILYTGEPFKNVPNKIRLVMDVIIDGEFQQNNPTAHVIPASANQKIWVSDHQKNWYVLPARQLPINQEEQNGNTFD